MFETLSRQREGTHRTFNDISTLLELFLYATFPDENHYHDVAQTLIAILDVKLINE